MFRAASAGSSVLALFSYAQTALNADAAFYLGLHACCKSLLPTILMCQQVLYQFVGGVEPSWSKLKAKSTSTHGLVWHFLFVYNIIWQSKPVVQGKI